MKNLLNVLSILSIAGIVALSFFSWYSGDDLCYKNELARYTVFQKAWLQFLHWDGRSLGIASLIQLTGLKYFPAPVISLIWSLAFIINSFLILKIVALRQPNSAKQVSLVSIGILSSILWLGLWKLIPDIIYWPTGGWYSVMSLLGLVWIYIFNHQLLSGKFTGGRDISIFILSLVCGNNSHNLIISLLLLAFIALLHSTVITKDRSAVVYILCAIAGLTVSACFVMLAPGNQERLNAIAWSGFNRSFLFNCIIVTVKYVYWLFALFALLLIFLRLSVKSNPDFQANYFSNLKKTIITRETLITFVYKHQYLLAAFSTVIVFSATSFFAVPRTAIFFAVFIVLYVLDRFKVPLNNFTSKIFLKGSIIYLTVCLITISFEGIRVNELKEKLNARESIYALNKGCDLCVNPISEKEIPFAFTFVDITPDSNHWVNRCVALQYNLKTVRTIKN